MKFPPLWVVVDTTSKKWLGNATQRNKTSAGLTATGAPRLFTKRSAATQAMNAWLKGEHFYEYVYSGPEHGMESAIQVHPVYAREKAALRVVSVDVVTEDDYGYIKDEFGDLQRCLSHFSIPHN